MPATGRPTVTVELDGEEESLRARLVVGADGKRSAVRRWTGGESAEDPEHHRFGGVAVSGIRTEDRDTDNVAGPPGTGVNWFAQSAGTHRLYLMMTQERLREHGIDRSFDDLVTFAAGYMPEGALGVGPAGGAHRVLPEQRHVGDADRRERRRVDRRRGRVAGSDAGTRNGARVPRRPGVERAPARCRRLDGCDRRVRRAARPVLRRHPPVRPVGQHPGDGDRRGSRQAAARCTSGPKRQTPPSGGSGCSTPAAPMASSPTRKRRRGTSGSTRSRRSRQFATSGQRDAADAGEDRVDVRRARPAPLLQQRREQRAVVGRRLQVAVQQRARRERRPGAQCTAPPLMLPPMSVTSCP